MGDLQLPLSLRSDDDQSTKRAVETLQCYYGRGRHAGHGTQDRGSTPGTARVLRQANTNWFTADDLVAVSMLSVDMPAEAAIQLIDTEAAEFSALLEQLGPDRDLVDETEVWR